MNLGIDYTNDRFWGLSKEILNATTLKGFVDQRETPNGYKAVPKNDVVDALGSFANVNVCTKCDYRETCCKGLDLVKCMSYARKDGVGVVFKKIE